MSSRSKHDDAIVAADVRVGALLADDADENTGPRRAWQRRALGGMTVAEAAKTAATVRPVPLRLGIPLAGAASEVAKAAGMSRESWIRHLMAVEVIRVQGGDYDELVGPYSRTRPRLVHS
jgi:hypothetical protein